MKNTLTTITSKVNFRVDLIKNPAFICSRLLVVIAILYAFSGVTLAFSGLHYLTHFIYFNSSLLGAVCIYGFYYQSPKKIYHLCCYALLLFGIIFCLQRFNTLIFPAIILCLWLAAIYQLSIDKSKASKSILACCIFLPVAIYLSVFLLHLTVVYDHKTMDWLLYSVDATFGGHINFLIGHYFYYLPSPCQASVQLIYVTIPLAWSIMVCIKVTNQQPLSQQLFTEYLLLGLIGASLYHVIPAYGPCYALQPWWPLHAPVTPIIPAVTNYYGSMPRNCMPSLHTAWAYCIWRQTRTCSSTIRFLSTLWLGLILFSLLALGQHYLVDVMVGFILAVLVRGLCATALPKLYGARFTAIFAGAALMCMWYLLILFGLHLLRFSIFIPWMLLLLTIYIAGRAEHRLAVAQQTF